MLGDGYLNKYGSSTNAHLSLEFSVNKGGPAFIDYLLNIFLNLVHPNQLSQFPKPRNRIISKSSKVKTHVLDSLYFWTRALPCFTEFWHIFIDLIPKVVAPNL